MPNPKLDYKLISIDFLKFFFSFFSGDLLKPWPVPSRPPVNPPEAKPLVSSWLPRLPARALLLPGA